MKTFKNSLVLGFLLGLSTVTGCVTPGEKAKMEAQAKVENARLETEADAFHDGWAKLKKGMSAKQVADLLGGVPPKWAEIDQNSKEGKTTENDTRAYKLVFDGGGLAEWSLR